MNDFSGVLNYKVVQDSPNPPPTRKFFFFFSWLNQYRAHTLTGRSCFCLHGK